MNKPEITRKALLDAATELNNLLDPDPKIKTVAVKTEALIEAVKVAADLLEDGDGITEATNDLLLTLGVELPEGIEIAAGEETDAEEASEAEAEAEVSEPVEVALEDLVALAEEMNEVMQLDPIIDISIDEDELKAEIMANCYDKKGLCQVYDTDSFSEAAWNIFTDIGVVPVKEVTEAEAAKAPGEKTEKAGKVKKEKAVKPAKTEKAASAPKGPGVIKTIVSTIKEKGPITKEAILAILIEAFPERDADAMKKTLNVQIPNRINKEQGITIVNSDKGWSVKK